MPVAMAGKICHIRFSVVGEMLYGCPGTVDISLYSKAGRSDC